VDFVEQVIGGIAGEDVRQARFDAHPDEGQQALVLPLLVGCELLITEFHPGLVMRIGGVRA